MAASTGKGLVTGLIGQPISHSLSPVIHEHWIAEHGLDACYVPFRHVGGNLAGLESALRSLELRGFNITVPFKSQIIPYLDQIDPAAEAIGAVNTVVVDKNARWHGYNTDGAGFYRHLVASTEPAQLARGLEQVLVLGAGGAARAIVAALAKAGARDIVLCNRSEEKAEALKQELLRIVGHTRLATLPWEARHGAVGQCRLLINTTSLGMAGQPPLTMDLRQMPSGSIVTDIVYAPLETELLKAAKAHGHVTVDGLGMLLGQAAEAFSLWFHVLPVVTPALREKMLAARSRQG